MQEMVFELLSDQPGHLQALEPRYRLRIQATNLEELQHEAREALFGPSHVAYRVKLRRSVRHQTHGRTAAAGTTAVFG
jgi:hypothetical protein